jgi:hypothetical protein
MEKVLNDRIAFSDKQTDEISIPHTQTHGLWARTEIMGSYNDIEFDKNGIFSRFIRKIPTGITSLGEKIFRVETAEPNWTQSNMVPIGGCQFAMEMLFGVKSDLDIPTLRDKSADIGDVGIPDSTGAQTTYDIPGGTKTVVYEHGNIVQLFGIGITDTAENDTTVPNVDYREYSINNNRVTRDGLTLKGTMVPFRHTTHELNDNDKLKYFGKKLNDNGTISYYLKRFESDPTIKHVWKTSDDTGTETSAIASELWTNNIAVNVVESFTEFTLKITKNDVKEWFAAQGQEDRARINTIALFTGQYVKNEDGTLGDYRDVRMFSKLHIPTEYLSVTKDLNLVYRVYTS